MSGPFIMNPEGVARLFTRGLMRDGPFPAHYEPFESPMVNIMAPKIRGNPASRIFKNDLAQLGDAKDYPYAATSYRLTEHFPLLDEAFAGECDHAAGVLRGDLGAACR